MLDWLHALARQTAPVILVTVAVVEGSAPRAPGAKMLVSRERSYDTIGGGHLEMRALDIAQRMLAGAGEIVGDQKRFERFALGPGLGQCCGGVVHLLFERITPDLAQPMIGALLRRWTARRDTWRVIALDGDADPSLFDRAGADVGGGHAGWPPGWDVNLPCRVVADTAGRRWLIDPCLAYRPHLLLFGAGHVGTALVSALADLPCHVTWVDERDAMFPPSVPQNVRIEATDSPQALVEKAPSGTSFLVMTHSHALDQDLSEHILRREHGEWFGLIGSGTKRAQFEHRLRERGVSAAQLARMVCPIGLPTIRGKAPAVIAASVAAQLLQLWEAAENAASVNARGMGNE